MCMSLDFLRLFSELIILVSYDDNTVPVYAALGMPDDVKVMYETREHRQISVNESQHFILSDMKENQVR